MIGLIGLSLLLQASYMILIYNAKYPLYQIILGAMSMVAWFATGHVSLSLNPDEGIAMAYVYDAIGTIDVLFAVKASFDFVRDFENGKKWWM